jgi:hypothetical protein
MNEAMRKCEVCGSTSDVVNFDCAGRGILIVPVCQPCCDNGRFKTWLEEQMELALNQLPDWEPVGSGKWQRKGD